MRLLKRQSWLKKKDQEEGGRSLGETDIFGMFKFLKFVEF